MFKLRDLKVVLLHLVRNVIAVGTGDYKTLFIKKDKNWIWLSYLLDLSD